MANTAKTITETFITGLGPLEINQIQSHNEFKYVFSNQVVFSISFLNTIKPEEKKHTEN